MPFETNIARRKFSVINLLKTCGFRLDSGHCTLTLQLPQSRQRYFESERPSVNLKGKGLLLFSSCSHAGIINVLESAQSTFDIPIYGIFGGLHLVGTLEKIIPDTIENMKKFNLKQIVPAHSTGFRALYALLHEFGEEVVVPSVVGSRFTF